MYLGITVVLDGGVRATIGARAIRSGVRIRVFSVHGLGVRVEIHGVRHEATIAARVAGGSAINELLLRKAVEIAVLDGVVGLELSVGGEGPAATAAALVLHWVDNAMFSPVDTSAGENLVG